MGNYEPLSIDTVNEVFSKFDLFTQAVASVDVRNKIAERIIYYSNDFMPYDTGKLMKSAKAVNGKIIQDVPYAKKLYYSEELSLKVITYEDAYQKLTPTKRLKKTASNFWVATNGGNKVEWVRYRKSETHSNNGIVYNKAKHPLAGPRWFERGMKAHGAELQKGVGDIYGAKWREIFNT